MKKKFNCIITRGFGLGRIFAGIGQIPNATESTRFGRILRFGRTLE